MVLLHSAVTEDFFDRTMHMWEKASRHFGETYCPHLERQVYSRRKKNTQPYETLEDGDITSLNAGVRLLFERLHIPTELNI
jgi:hypothetical protein